MVTTVNQGQSASNNYVVLSSNSNSNSYLCLYVVLSSRTDCLFFMKTTTFSILTNTFFYHIKNTTFTPLNSYR
jgi:hypothetical protein